MVRMRNRSATFSCSLRGEFGGSGPPDCRRSAESNHNSLASSTSLTRKNQRIISKCRTLLANNLGWKAALLLIASYLPLVGCGSRRADAGPSINFIKVPPAAEGGSEVLEEIEGRASGARPNQQIVLFARSGVWWVQPYADRPFIQIQPDSTWRTSTHLGTEYAALLVEEGYRPPTTTDELPGVGAGVIAVATTHGGERPQRAPDKTLNFSGYEWVVRSVPSDRGGTTNAYDPANAWTDSNGALHLRIARSADKWTCAEVRLTHSLGYGSYRFVVRETSHLEPALVLGLFMWDDREAGQNHREMDIEITRWGDPDSKNAQYVVQPFYVPANVHRFTAPQGRLTHSIRWEPERVSFRTTRGSEPNRSADVIAEHVFTSGVPTPGGETVRMNLYVFGNAESPLQNEAEVVIEKFEYFP
jgi:hypothetical protein